jgi:hypothetical protein
MKKYFYCLLVSLALFSSCEYETLPTYSGQNEVFFDYASSTVESSIIDSTFVRFGFDPVVKLDSTISIVVRTIGHVTDFDRPVDFTLDEAISTAILNGDVELLKDKSFISAGKTTGRIYVKVKNTEKLNGQNLLAGLVLTENEYFKTAYKLTLHTSINKTEKIDATKYRVWFDNTSDIPQFWAHPTYATRLNMFFGPYSLKKFRIMCELFGFDWDYFSYPSDLTSTQISALYNVKFPSALSMAWSRAFNIYLDEYEILYGERLKEDNGTVMIGGSIR